MGTRVMYPKKTKLAAIEMKKEGYTTKQIMNELHIMNKTQVETWWRWYRNGELHRLEQPVGKQYVFGFGPEEYDGRSIVAYTIGETQDLSFILDTLSQVPEQTTHCLLHSDQGSVYTSAGFQNALK